MSLAILAYLENKDKEFAKEFATYCYIILSRVDNIQQGQHLHEVISEEKSFLLKFDEALNLELSAKKALASLQLPDKKLPIYISHFQKKLWAELHSADRITAISGPTSSGKSYMVQNYIVDLCKTRDTFKALYIVPSRALIAEVSSELRNRLGKDEVSIRVAVGQAEEIYPREIFVLTPERCLQILRDPKGERKFDLIFMDEIQKVEDGERGVIFEYVLNELMRLQVKANVVLAGPYLKNLRKTIVQLTGAEGNTVESKLSPVYQLKTIFTLSNNSQNRIDITIKNTPESEISTFVYSDTSLYQAFKNQPIPAMAKFVSLFGEDSTNIIYAPTRTHAEKYALELAKIRPSTKLNEEVSQLIEYLKTEIHPNYSLIRCLKKGVAFHHGMLPEIAKSEIEDLYKKGIMIKNLSCTTTLLEGVNLPTDRLFIHRAYKNNKTMPLDNFDFGNLIGRAGRVFSGLNGSVYCVQLDDEEWAKEKLASNPDKEIVPVTNTATSGDFKDLLMSNLDKPVTEIFAPEAVVSTLVFLRQKAIRDQSELLSYLKSKNLSAGEVLLINEGISKSVENLAIGRDLKDVVRLNPSLDPILQNKLYQKISEDGWDKWLITKTPSLKFSKKENREYSFKDKTFYFQFEDITSRLNQIFYFIERINDRNKGNKNSKRWTPLSFALYGALWIEQASMSYIIENEINFIKRTQKKPTGDKEENPREIKKKEAKLIDRTILQVSRHVYNDVRFELVKYFKLWADILNEMLTKELSEEGKKNYDYYLSLPLMLT